jgi:hypothetical protein
MGAMGNRIALALALPALLATAAHAAPREHRWTWRQRPSPDAVHACRADMSRVLEVAPDAAEAIPRALREATPAWIELGLMPPGKDEGEPFLFPGLEFANRARTRSDRYDAVVTALLLVARDHFPQGQLSIASSAGWDDWRAGAELYDKALGRVPQPPFDQRAPLKLDPGPVLFAVLLLGALGIFAVLGLIGMGKAS